MSDLMNDKNYIEELRQQIQWLQKTLLQRDQQLAQARDMFERLLLWLEQGRFRGMENQHFQIHMLNEIRAFLAQRKEAE